jgi:hypothetical protein
MDTLLYVAPPGQLKLGVTDPLVNTEPALIKIEGYAIPGHLDNDGHCVRAGFDITSMSLANQTEFASAHSLVYAPKDYQLHWRQVPQALQWADEKAYEGFAGSAVKSSWERALVTDYPDFEISK